MGYISAIILLFVALFLHINKRKKWYAPDVLFCYMWSAITFMSSLHLYGMYKSSDFVYLIILIGSISYVFGVSQSYKSILKQSAPVSATTQDFISKKIFWVFCLVLFILRLEPFIKSLVLLLAGVDLQTMRNDFFEQSRSAKEVLIGTGVSLFKPLVEITGIVYFVRDIKRNYMYMVAVLLLALMEATIDGGRFGMAFLIIELIVCYSICSERPNISFLNLKKYRGKIIRYVFVLVGLIIAITLLRGTEVEEMFKKYYRYFCGNVIFFDRHIDFIKTLPLYPLGTGLWGFWLQFFPLLHAIIGLPYPSWYLDATNNVMCTQEFYQIGEDLYTNAFSTPFYYLYADLRIPGVILGMLIFGYFAGISYRKMLMNDRNKYLIIYILVCQMIFMTIYFYPFTNTGYVLIILFLMYLRIKKRA